jgi:putative ABC transport system permease protein
MRSDLRYALRSFLKTPAVTAIVVLTLALGIGANTAIFTVVNAVLLRPLPYERPETLLRVRHGTSYPDMRDWIQQTSSFSGIGGFRPQNFDYASAQEVERLDGALVTGGLLSALGASPLRGRLIDEHDNRAGAERVVLVTAEFWRTRLGADPGAVGRGILFSGSSYTIAGVLQPGFALPGARAEVLAPFYPETPREADARGAHTLRAIVRLRGAVPVQQAQQDLDALALRLEAQYPESNRGVRFVLQPLRDSLVGDVRPALTLLLATVVFVLLIACVNVANLLIARGAARRSEMAIRAALGAGRRRLARQLLTESSMLAIAGGTLGLFVAYWATQAVIALAPAGVPHLEHATLDARVLAFTGLVALAAGVLFGVLPAWAATSTVLADASRSGSRTTARGNRARAALMVAEVALALVLLVGAGLLLRSFHALTQQDVGFDTEHLTTANITFSARRYFDIQTRTRLFEAYEEAVREMPGVAGVALTTDIPIGGSPIFHNLAFEGRPMAPGTEPEVYYRGISTDYFDVLRIPLLRGRTFTPLDRAGAPLVAVVNEAFVRQYYPAEEPLGRRIRWASGSGEWITIIGIVADVRGLSLDRGEVPAVHVPYRQEGAPWRMWMDVAVRTEGAAPAIAAALRRELSRLDTTVPLTKVSTMEQILAGSVADRRFSLYLLGAFALLSLLLAAAGTYGVMAYAVAQRTRELGVRIALGARPSDVFGLIVGRGVALTVAGIALGIVGALAVTRLMKDLLAGMLFGVGPTDAAAFAGAAAVLLAAALVACYVPARRAATVDPIVALRSE